ncbi:STAS domain-containing protein [Spirillospora sp. NPDC127506]
MRTCPAMPVRVSNAVSGRIGVGDAVTAAHGPCQADPPDRSQAAGAEPAPGSGGGLGDTTERRGRRWMLVVAGELDTATVPALDYHVPRALSADSPPRVALELSGVRFCDSSGINAFVRGWKRARAARAESWCCCVRNRGSRTTCKRPQWTGPSPSPPLCLSDNPTPTGRRPHKGAPGCGLGRGGMLWCSGPLVVARWGSLRWGGAQGQ